MSRYTLTVEDATLRFAEAGVPRASRTIQRYCKRGILDCALIDTSANEQYLIDPTSLERRVVELQQIFQATDDASGRDKTRQDATGRDRARHDATFSEKESQYQEQIKQLETDNENLRFDGRVSRELANFMRDQNRELVSRMNDQSRMIGRLETELRALQAPRSARVPDDARSSDEIISTEQSATPVTGDIGEGDNSASGERTP